MGGGIISCHKAVGIVLNQKHIVCLRSTVAISLRRPSGITMPVGFVQDGMIETPLIAIRRLCCASASGSIPSPFPSMGARRMFSCFASR